METLDAVMHQPLRTQIVAYLAGAQQATFTELRTALEVSDGNLESHMKKLIAAGYVEVSKQSGEGRTQSYYTLTRAGRAALKAYVNALQRLLPMKKTAAAVPAKARGRL